MTWLYLYRRRVGIYPRQESIQLKYESMIASCHLREKNKIVLLPKSATISFGVLFGFISLKLLPWHDTLCKLSCYLSLPLIIFTLKVQVYFVYCTTPRPLQFLPISSLEGD